MVGLAYAFLVELLRDVGAELLPAILRWAHHTGRQAKAAWRSHYRLSVAIAALWQRHTPIFRRVP